MEKWLTEEGRFQRWRLRFHRGSDTSAASDRQEVEGGGSSCGEGKQQRGAQVVIGAF
jgi:hypothetical protein